MKKRLFAFILVLCLASIANAHLIFTVNGAPQPDEITICPSDMIELGLELSEGENILKYTLQYALTNEQAEFLIDNVTFPWGSCFPGIIGAYDEEGIISWLQIGADDMLCVPDPGPLVLMEGLVIHCLEETDVVMEISVAGDTVINGQVLTNGEVLHTLTIHQIPEPATMLLLGLGGLFLRRRK